MTKRFYFRVRYTSEHVTSVEANEESTAEAEVAKAHELADTITLVRVDGDVLRVDECNMHNAFGPLLISTPYGWEFGPETREKILGAIGMVAKIDSAWNGHEGVSGTNIMSIRLKQHPIDRRQEKLLSAKIAAITHTLCVVGTRTKKEIDARRAARALKEKK